MLGRVGLVDRHGELGAAADEAFAAFQHGVVHGRRLQALAREQLQRAVLALEIDRADVGHHDAGDLVHDPVEPRLPVVGSRP